MSATEVTSVGHRPQAGEKWTFGASVTECFDDMLRRSIPDYDGMRQTVFDIGSQFVRPHTTVLDIGCSRGDSIAPFVDAFGADVRFVGLENSEPMLTAAQDRFKFYRDTVQIKRCDLRKHFPIDRTSLVLSVLTLQFVPIEHRQRIIADIHDSLIAGGAFVLVEKLLGATAMVQRLLVDRYHAMKQANGYSLEDVEAKRVSLEGALVPLTAKQNIGLLHDAGFQHVDCVWRRLNFAGFIAVKE